MISGRMLGRNEYGLIGQAAGGAAASYPLLDNLIAYWNLDEASGNRADSHTNGLHLTDNNTVGVSSGGGPDGGNAALFVAANSEYLSRASETLLSAGDIDYTWTCWVYGAAWTGVQAFIAKAKATPDYDTDYDIYNNGNTSKFDYAILSSATQKKVAVTPPSTGAWHFLVFWHDSTANTVNLQIDNGTVNSAATAGIIPGTNSGALLFGARGTPNAGQYLNGRMAYAGFWKRLLTSDERSWLYNSGAGRTYAAVAGYTG